MPLAAERVEHVIGGERAIDAVMQHFVQGCDGRKQAE